MRGIIYLYFLLLLLFLFVCYANSDLQWTMETNQHNTMSTTGLVAESVSLTGSALAQFCRSTAGYAKYDREKFWIKPLRTYPSPNPTTVS